MGRPDGSTTTTSTPAEGLFGLAELDAITPSEHNPRTITEADADMIASVKRHGVIEPIVANAAGEIIAGHRRLAAARAAGLTHVPVITRDVDDEQADAMRLIENLHRLDLTPLEEAEAYRRLVDVHGYTQKQLAAAVGMNQGHVSKRLALLKLEPEMIELVNDGTLPIAEAVSLSRLPKILQDKVATDVARGIPAALAVETAGRRVAELKERGEVLAELKARKPAVTIIDLAVEGSSSPSHDDGLPLSWLSPDVIELHAAKCKHAVFVVRAERAYSGWTEEWCLYVEAHQRAAAEARAANPTPGQAATDIAMASLERERAELAEREELHHAASAKLLTGSLPKSAGEHVAMWWLTAATLDDWIVNDTLLARASQLLHGRDAITVAEAKQLVAEISTPNDRGRWSLALVLADGCELLGQARKVIREAATGYRYQAEIITMAQRHLAYLVKHAGLELDETEQALLDWRPAEPKPVDDTELPADDEPAAAAS